MSRIDSYLDALFDAFAATGRIAPWPINIAKIFPYFSDLEAEDLYDRLRRVAPGGPDKVAEMFINPSVTRALLMDLTPGIKALPSVGREEAVWFVETIFDALQRVQRGDIFCRDGRYLRLTEEELVALQHDLMWVDRADPEAVALAYKASASAQALIWALFFYGWTDIAFEIHGPYDVADDDGAPRQRIVRDFFDLRPLEVWPDMTPLGFDRLLVVADMTSDSSPRVDIFNHLTHSGNLHEETTRIAVLVDGEPVCDAKWLAEIVRSLIDHLQAQHARVVSLDRKSLIYKFIETRYYAFRKWRTPFAQDWRPPAAVRERIERWDEIDIPLTGGPSKEALRRAYDPRDPFTFE